MECQGKAVIPELARLYKQLYLRPGEMMQYQEVVQKGKDPVKKDLSHFIGDERDSVLLAETAAGEVAVITLNQRADFETFLQIMAKGCRREPIPRTQGATIIDGVINWTKISDHKAEFLEAEKKGGKDSPDWAAEFKRFTADGRNYKDVLIVLGTGPYSGIPASALGLTDEEWLTASYTIRQYHECTHFICRRKYPDKIDPIWDELVADTVGIYAAFGKFDLHLAQMFLGVDEDGYIGGRIANYAEPEELDTLAKKLHKILTRFERVVEAQDPMSPFELAYFLEEKKDEFQAGL